jgi:hypothetical protein
MNLSGLLRELRHNMLRDRSDLVSGPSDQLWDDETLVTYINEAQNRFCREALIIRDSATPAVTQLLLEAGRTVYDLHPSVLGVLSMKYPADAGDLARAGHAVLGTYYMPDTYFFDPGILSNLPPGKVKAFTTDEGFSNDINGSSGVSQLRVYPVPTAEWAQTLSLRVVRGPLTQLTLNDLEAYPDVPADQHVNMLDWAAYLALRGADHDVEDQARAEGFKAAFLENVADARKEAMRKLFTPLQWGFGRNGFSWQGNI